MAHSAQDRKLFLSETSSTFLQTRLRFNQEYSRINFNDWLFKRLRVKAGEVVLDVGCGTGSQSIQFLKEVGPLGHVCSTDISAESVSELQKNSLSSNNLEACVGDMVYLKSMVSDKFTPKYFDLTHSSYALYYANDHYAVLDTMKNVLKEAGRMAVFSPNQPHGMVNFIRKFTRIPVTVDQSLNFGPDILEQYFKKEFWEVEVHFFQNVLTLESIEDLIQFYRATTYYNKSAEGFILAESEKQLNDLGVLNFEKSGYLIIGSQKRNISKL